MKQNIKHHNWPTVNAVPHALATVDDHCAQAAKAQGTQKALVQSGLQLANASFSTYINHHRAWR